MKAFLGVDVGSVSTNLALLSEGGQVIDSIYIRTKGNPISAIQNGLKELKARLTTDIEVVGAGTTGSARQLTGVLVGADTVKNEITAHAVAAMHVYPEVQTVLEIGGQDSKIIIIRDGIVVDFAMNTVCAAGTGSFLDHQAERLNIPIEQFGDLALKSQSPVRIAGRCGVFAESDMIHKQQTGHQIEDIIAGLCQALVRNYLNNVGKGKEIKGPVIFQGGVAANKGIKAYFEKILGLEVQVPVHHGIMGAIGAALLAKQAVKAQGKTNFKGFSVSELNYYARSFECSGCPNHCEVVQIYVDKQVLARWGDRCGKWSMGVASGIAAS